MKWSLETIPIIQKLRRGKCYCQLVLWLRKQRRKRETLSYKDMSIVYRVEDGKLIMLSGRKEGGTGISLPGGLILDPGRYAFEGLVYDCTVPGIYRFSKPQKQNQQRIVIASRNGFQAGLSLSHLFARGIKDDYETMERMKEEAEHRFLICTCGPASHFVQGMLEKAGFESRVVYSHTLAEMNSYNNGHTMVEVFNEDKRKYQLIDVDKKVYFYHPEKGILDLLQFCHLLHDQKPLTLRRFGPSGFVDWTGFIEDRTEFNYQFIEYLFNYDDQSLIDWYRRVAEIPMMFEKGYFYVTTWDPKCIRMSPIREGRWIPLSSEDFHAKYYSHPGEVFSKEGNCL